MSLGQACRLKAGLTGPPCPRGGDEALGPDIVCRDGEMSGYGRGSVCSCGREIRSTRKTAVQCASAAVLPGRLRAATGKFRVAADSAAIMDCRNLAEKFSA